MIRRIAAALGGLLLCATAAHGAPLEAYGKLPNVERAAVSPSGAHLALIVTNGEERVIVVQTTAAERKNVLVAPAGKAKIRTLSWAGEDYLIIASSSVKLGLGLSGLKAERSVGFDLNVKTKRLHQLLDDTRNVQSMNIVIGEPAVRTVDGRTVAYVRGIHFPANRSQIGLFKVDLETKAARLVEDGRDGAEDWLVDKSGEVVAAAGYNDQKGVWTLRLKTPNGAWRTVEKVSSKIETPDLLGLTPDGKAVIVDFVDGVTGGSWRELSIETAAWGEPTVDSSSATPLFAPGEGRIVGKHALVGDEHRYMFFDSKEASAWRAILKAFPGDQVELVSWSDDRRKVLVRVDSVDLGPALAFVDLNLGTANWLGPEYEGLRQAADFSPRKPFRYKAADGLDIPGYLTLPRGREPRNLPLIVLAHGGPASRDGPGFDWWAQALASRGYAVLQPNFRGSSGFGWRFQAAGFGEFGRKMQTDLSDGVRELVRQGLIDPRRVCIAGSSYGGYAALAGAAFDRGVYRCAVSVSGPSDLRSQIAHSGRRGGRDVLLFWQRFIGAKDQDDPVLDSYSPALHAAKVDIPILLIHGRDDTIVALAQSRRMADAMKAAGKPVELVELAGEDHWLSTGATRLQMLQAMVAFLERHNPPN